MNNTAITIEAAHIRSGQQIYVVAGVAPSSEFDTFERTFAAATRTFRNLSREEANAIQPNRVDFYTVRGNDTWDSIARGTGGGTVKPSTLAIMNGGDAATPPRAGTRIRIVVAG